jgi:hypothetical protein
MHDEEKAKKKEQREKDQEAQRSDDTDQSLLEKPGEPSDK